MPTTDEELARARLAWISAGQRPLSAPRRALADEEEEDEDQGRPQGQPQEEPSAEALPRVLELAMTRRYAMAVGILLLIGVAITVAVLARSQASQVELDPTPPQVAVSEPAPSPTAPPEPVVVQIRVHVLGAVVAPGVVSLPDGAIVADALAAAGGLGPDADPAELNLAARLGDGQQVIVGTTAEPQGDVRDPGGGGGGGDGGGDGQGAVDLNTATLAQLETLPGVGPVLAGAIIAWRQDNGGFSSVADLQEVPGIGPKTFATLEPLVTV